MSKLPFSERLWDYSHEMWRILFRVVDDSYREIMLDNAAWRAIRDENEQLVANPTLPDISLSAIQSDVDTNIDLQRAVEQMKIEKEAELHELQRECRKMLLKMRNEAPEDSYGYELCSLGFESQIEALGKEIRRINLMVGEKRTESIPESVLQAARETPITELLPEYRRQGRNKVAKCPFHEEKTASFVMYDDNSWHCYGCGANGSNAIDFLMQRDNLSFRDAVRILT